MALLHVCISVAKWQFCTASANQVFNTHTRMCIHIHTSYSFVGSVVFPCIFERRFRGLTPPLPSYVSTAKDISSTNSISFDYSTP